ncbi:MAG: type II toxin-antitoxin system RelE/ParE family toxin [Clostridia bacterium]|nr:type II toxin-antitoxin system RelE/ParE family toxin [Clostridia bacterium]
MYKIIFYTDKNGKSDLLDYINKLRSKKENKESRIKLNKITAYINQLAKNGLSIGKPYIKHIEDDIWELRPLRDRIFFSDWNKNEFILISNFIKKTQKTPKKEIEKAKRLLKEYKERGNFDE